MRRTAPFPILAAAGIVAAATLGPTLVSAQITEAVRGDAAGDLLYLDAANLNALAGEGLFSVAEITLSETHAQLDNGDGLGDGILTRGFGRNLDSALLGQDVPLDLSTAEQTAPPDNAEPTVTELIDLSTADPLLNGAISRSTAWARDPALVPCPVDGREPIAMGTSSTTDAGLLNMGEANLISLSSTGGDTVATVSGIYLGADGSIISEANGQTVGVNIAGELDIDVINPILTATATGQPGGASVDYTGEVRVNGDKVAGFQENQISLDALADLLGPLDEGLDQLFGPIDESVLTPVQEEALRPILEAIGADNPDADPLLLSDLLQDESLDLGQLEILSGVVRVTAGQLENVVEAADGTHASGEVKTVRVELTLVSSLLDTEVPIFTLHLLPLSANAEVPEGGVDCGLPPLTVVKDGPETVVAGDSFDYTITVTNDLECTATDVVVVDTITGPAGFSVTSTDPTADSVENDVVTWEVDELAPGDSIVFTVSVQVPEDAAPGSEFSNVATADANCDDQPLPRGEDTLTGPIVMADADILDEDIQLPRTGGSFALLAMGALAAAGVLRRRW